ncbi:hypothetical protein [Dyadobacter sandarakinus]|uniref:Uncharacterized protein n=1 Tax=Dyadobacter sandarakinus TaxID=2747268 RepID=A0ABX7I8A6_9BACT|nr:hypothetical protein [Dyadobacter sandarakinus]QRR02063.1 hypothetical protein HWI92_14680 [Dyadobacter sandarakinus]
MITISRLPLIESAEQFYAAGMILLVDALFVGDTPRNMRELIKTRYGGFIYNKQTYIPITLTGTPESLLANAGKPIHFKFDRGFENYYAFDGNLEAAIWHKKLYDITTYMGLQEIVFEREEAFITERYLENHREFPQSTESLLTPVNKATTIGTKALTGFKPVRKR